MDITQTELKEFCSYDPATGLFDRIKAMSPRQARRVGKPCGSVNSCTGYVTFHVGGSAQYAHRLAWIYMHGAIPDGYFVDHKDGDVANNRIANLRIALHADNLRNCKKRRDNTSGVKGVSFDRSRGQWMAYVGTRKLGRFETLFDAACARKSAALQAFGEFARD
jgi:hypothetical protein